MTNDEKIDAILDVLGGDMGDQDERAIIESIIQHAYEVAAVLQNRNPRMAGYPSCDDTEQLPIT